MSEIDLAIKPFDSWQAFREFALSGKAVFEVRSRKTGKSFAYRIRKGDGIWFVERESKSITRRGAWDYIGIIGDRGYRWTDKAKPFRTSRVVKAFAWLWAHVDNGGDPLRDGVEIWHRGRCGRCGRELTDPESIAIGLGPVCAQYVGGA